MTDAIVISTKPGKDASYYAEILAKQTSPIGRLIIVRAPGCEAETDVFPAVRGDMEDKSLEENEVIRANLSVPETLVLKSSFASVGYLLTQGVKAASSDTLLFLNEDVQIVDEQLTERLCAALSEETAMAFSRTLPGEKSTRIRDAYQAFLNPPASEDRTAYTLFRKGILQFYTGGSAVMLTREALTLAGGFDAEALVDPFSIVAAELFYLGKTLHYDADAVAARKPKSASPAAVFHRAFDLSAGMRAHLQIFGLFRRYDYKDAVLHKHPVILMTRPGVYTAKFGFAVRMLSKQGRIYAIPALLFLLLLELLGNALGYGFHLWPTGLSRFFSGHRSWFSN